MPTQLDPSILKWVFTIFKLLLNHLFVGQVLAKEESVPKNIDFAVIPLPETLKEVFEELEVLDGSTGLLIQGLD